MEDFKNENLIDHLFRHEAGKMVSVLTRIFGIHNLELAEDVVQEAFIKATEEWKYKGIPDNPSAWLMKVARNKAVDVIRRQKHITEFSADISPLLKSEYTISTIQQFFLDSEIEDSQLRMMFACCHPALEPEVQIAITLKNISGFSTAEIAKALLSTEEAIQKRLYRAKALIRENNIQLEIPSGSQLSSRLNTVLSIIYLLFNEGYNSSHADMLIRKDLCEEAMRLAYILSNHALGKKPATFALLGLMCFHSSRFVSRLDEKGDIVLLGEQNRSGWDKELINLGFDFMERSAEGTELTEYHLEAAIAAEHCRAESITDTNWDILLQLYDLLLIRKDSAMVRLSRAIIISRLGNPEEAIKEILAIHGIEKLLKSNYLFNSVLGELYINTGNGPSARKYLEAAIKLTESRLEKSLLHSKLSILENDNPPGKLN